MRDWICPLSPGGRLPNGLESSPVGGPFRTGAQLKLRIRFTFVETAHHSLVVAPLVAAICLTDGPKACFAHLAQRS